MSAQEILYGRQPVCEMLLAGRRTVTRLMMADNVRRSAAMIVRLEKLAAKRSLDMETVRVQELDRFCRSGNHQGVAAEVSEYTYAEWHDLRETGATAKRPALYLLVDHVQDPQNLGSMLRSADAAGVTGVIIPGSRAAAVTPAVVRASAGAAEHVAVAKVGNLTNVMRDLREDGVRLAGLDTDAEAVLYTAAELTGPAALVVGGEDEGLGRLVRDLCDVRIRIPMAGRVGSLNAAVSAAIALFEVRRQQS